MFVINVFSLHYIVLLYELKTVLYDLSNLYLFLLLLTTKN